MAGSVRPGAEAFRFEAGPLGALLLHGFTGSPASLRPFGEWLAARGVSSTGPLLPGHGTDDWRDLAAAHWNDWEHAALDALDELAGRCETVLAVGLSMGGALALHLGATHAERLAGVAVVNPYVRDPKLAAAPALGLVLRSVKGVGNDISKPGQDEICNDRIPLPAVATLSRFLRQVVRELPSMRLPLLVFSSRQDHTVRPANAELVAARAGSERKELVRLANSFHVATLDHDAELIFQTTLGFARSLAPAVGDASDGETSSST